VKVAVGVKVRICDYSYAEVTEVDFYSPETAAIAFLNY